MLLTRRPFFLLLCVIALWLGPAATAAACFCGGLANPCRELRFSVYTDGGNATLNTVVTPGLDVQLTLRPRR